MASLELSIRPVVQRMVQEQFTQLFADHIEAAAKQLAPAAGVEAGYLLGLLASELHARSIPEPAVDVESFMQP